MKNKYLISAASIFAIFVMLIFITPFMSNETSCIVWALFFVIGAFLILSQIKTKNVILNGFKKQPKTMQIFEVMCVISLLYDITHINNEFYISTIIIGLAVIVNLYMWFFKKEE